MWESEVEFGESVERPNRDNNLVRASYITINSCRSSRQMGGPIP